MNSVQTDGPTDDYKKRLVIKAYELSAQKCQTKTQPFVHLASIICQSTTTFIISDSALLF